MDEAESWNGVEGNSGLVVQTLQMGLAQALPTV